MFRRRGILIVTLGIGLELNRLVSLLIISNSSLKSCFRSSSSSSYSSSVNKSLDESLSLSESLESGSLLLDCSRAEFALA